MDINETFDRARESISARHVFSEPIQQGATTLIPAMWIRGGIGSGGGEESDAEKAGTDKGYGSGMGLRARPAGALLLREGEARWIPAVDVNRIISGIQVLAGIALVVGLGRRRRFLPLLSIRRLMRSRR